MKILIIGGTKFLGRHLIDAALENRHEVTIFHRGKHSGEDIENVEEIFREIKTRISKRVWQNIQTKKFFTSNQMRKLKNF